MMTNLDALAAEIHENAVAHGFWEAHDAEEIAFEMLHCEICEAIQADREGQAGVWYETPASRPRSPREPSSNWRTLQSVCWILRHGQKSRCTSKSKGCIRILLPTSCTSWDFYSMI